METCFPPPSHLSTPLSFFPSFLFLSFASFPCLSSPLTFLSTCAIIQYSSIIHLSVFFLSTFCHLFSLGLSTMRESRKKWYLSCIMSVCVCLCMPVTLTVCEPGSSTPVFLKQMSVETLLNIVSGLSSFANILKD